MRINMKLAMSLDTILLDTSNYKITFKFYHLQWHQETSHRWSKSKQKYSIFTQNILLYIIMYFIL